MKITLTGDNVTLVLCHIVVETIGKLLESFFNIFLLAYTLFLVRERMKLTEPILHSMIADITVAL